MSDSFPKLKNAPIVEAVLDIECDLPPTFEIAAIQSAARDAFEKEYPEFQPLLFHQHHIEQHGEEPLKHSAKHGMQALRFFKDDKKQLIQLRPQGFSFNRLAPYTSLDEYLPEMERTWRQFVEVAVPIQIQAIKLRYINSIALPMINNSVDLDSYFKVAPQLPDEENLMLRGFLTQYIVTDKITNNEAKIVLTPQAEEPERLVVLFDIETVKETLLEVGDWPGILEAIHSLRELKNRIFYNSLTKPCLQLFQNQN